MERNRSCINLGSWDGYLWFNAKMSIEEPYQVGLHAMIEKQIAALRSNLVSVKGD